MCFFDMKNQRFIAPLVGLTASTLAIGTVWIGGSSAVQFQDGRIAFNNPPRLVRYSVIPSSTGARNATYHFSISVPDNAVESLRYVEIVPSSGPPQGIDFRVNDVTAHEGAGISPGAPVAVVGSSLDSDSSSDTRANSMGVTFNPPLEPGQTATIVLRSWRNPSLGADYSYNVIAYPDPEVGVSHRMGTARFTIDDGNSFR